MTEENSNNPGYDHDPNVKETIAYAVYAYKADYADKGHKDWWPQRGYPGENSYQWQI